MSQDVLPWLVVAANVAVFGGTIVWNASRQSASSQQTSRALEHLAESVAQLDKTLSTEVTANAVQNNRLDTHDKRLDQHDGELRVLRGTVK